MDLNILLFVLSFAALSLITLWFVIGSKGKYWLKALAILTIPALGFLLFTTINSYRGWPYQTNALPINGLFITGLIDEPDPLLHDPGAIYIWEVVGSKPRAFQLPYSRGLHKAVLSAIQMEKQQQGTTITLRKSKHIRGKWHAYRLPPPKPPQKVQGH